MTDHPEGSAKNNLWRIAEQEILLGIISKLFGFDPNGNSLYPHR